MRKYDYIQYAGGLREYASEKNRKAASALARSIDDLIRNGGEPDKIAAFIHTAAPVLAATYARMIYLGRLFYCDLFGRFDKQTQYLILSNGACAPKEYQRLLKRMKDLAPEAMTDFIANLCSADSNRVKSAREFLRQNRWLMGRVLQDEVYMTCSRETKEFLLECARTGSSTDRRLFVAQMMDSERVPREEKVVVYRSLKPYDEQFIREKNDQVLIHTTLLGLDAHVNGAHLGLSVAYSNNANRPDYHLAVCDKVQRAYAESGYFRYQWSRSKLPGYEIVRCSFPRFAAMKDKWFNVGVKGEFGEAAIDDNPGYFKLMCDLNGIGIGLRQVAYLMTNRKTEVLRFLVRECREELEESISLTELLFYVSAYGAWDVGSVVAEEIERAEPGTIASAVDHFGNTPMWYTLYELETTNRYVSSSENEKSRLAYVRLLRSHGCDPYRKNHLGISYADLKGNER